MPCWSDVNDCSCEGGQETYHRAQLRYGKRISIAIYDRRSRRDIEHIGGEDESNGRQGEAGKGHLGGESNEECEKRMCRRGRVRKVRDLTFRRLVDGGSCGENGKGSEGWKEWSVLSYGNLDLDAGISKEARV
jgi:hypothetical protein